MNLEPARAQTSVCSSAAAPEVNGIDKRTINFVRCLTAPNGTWKSKKKVQTYGIDVQSKICDIYTAAITRVWAYLVRLV